MLGASLAWLSSFFAGMWRISAFDGFSLFDFAIVSPLAVASGYLVGSLLPYARGRLPGGAWAVAGIAAAAVATGVAGWFRLAEGPFSDVSHLSSGLEVGFAAVLGAVSLGALAAAGGWLGGLRETEGPGSLGPAAGLAIGAFATLAALYLAFAVVLLPNEGRDYNGALPLIIAAFLPLGAAAGAGAALVAGSREKGAAGLSAVCGLAAFSFAEIGASSDGGPSLTSIAVLLFVIVAAPSATVGGWLVGRVRRRRARPR